MPRSFVAIDLETTGLDVGRDRITEIGMVRFTLDGVSESFEALVNPERPIPLRIQQITGISDADVSDALHFNALRLEVEDFIGEAAIVGQNVSFDLGFLADEGVEPRGAVFDTLELASLLEPELRDRSLGALAQHYGIEMPVAHRALADADATRSVFLALYEQARSLPEALLAGLVALDAPLPPGLEEAEAPGWAVADLLREIARERGLVVGARRIAAPSPLRRDGRPAPPSPQRSLDQLVVEQAADAEPERPATAPLSDLLVSRGPSSLPSRPPRLAELAASGSSLPEQALAVLRAGAAHAELFGTFEDRPEQVGMTRAVAQALESDENLVVEAGTGTGKSLAYLIPAALWAMRHGRRVIVSTNTINLQEQLVQMDAPALRELIRDSLGDEVADALRVVTLKGRRNYLCLRRVAQERIAGPASDAEASLLGRILVWLQATDSGDRSELVLSNAEDANWAHYSAEGEDCLSGGNCPYVRDGSCFLLRARKAAEAAHVVIVNHALLLSNLAAPGTALPQADTVIVDEAHHLEESATSHLGAAVSFRSLAEVLDGVHRVSARGNDAGLVAGVDIAARDRRLDEETRSDLRASVARLPARVDTARGETDAFFRHLRRFTDDRAEDRFGNSARARLTSGTRAQPEWSEIEVAWDAVFGHLLEIEAELEALQASLEEITARLEGDDDWQGLVAEAASLRETLAERAELCGELLTQHDPQSIVWLTTQRRSELATINAAPLRVDALLQEQFFSQKRSVVLTGATLATQGNYDYLRERVGLEDAQEEHFGSPFDYRRAVRLILPADMPEPNDGAYPQALAGALVSLVRASEGRALVLFTAVRALRQAADAIREELGRDGITVIAQGLDGSPRRVMRELVANPRAVVLGVASLWEGVDVPGEAVSLVVIARLPFPVPSDPIYAARAELYEDPFSSYALPQAIVRFRQGFGRLIRRRADRGVVAVLDGRITSRRYGRAFVYSLPPVEVLETTLREIGAATTEWLQR